MPDIQQNGDRFLRRVMVGVLIGVILNIPLSIWWAASTNAQLSQQGKAIEKLEKKFDKLNATVVNSMDDRYRGSDAEKDFEKRDVKIDKLQGKVSRLEVKMARIP